MRARAVVCRPERLLELDEAIPLLLRDDGFHRPAIRLSPIALFADATVIMISWGNDGMDKDEWSEILPELSFTHEPFVIMGPPLPITWQENDPIPRQKLPQFDFEHFKEQWK
jgi:hypothetical protein